jgi:hypothetical protein
MNQNASNPIYALDKVRGLRAPRSNHKGRSLSVCS